MSFVVDAACSRARHLTRECLAILESTIYPALKLLAVGDEILAFADSDNLIDQVTQPQNEISLIVWLGDIATQRGHRMDNYDPSAATILEIVL